MTSPEGADWRRLTSDCRVLGNVTDFVLDAGYADAATFAFSFVDDDAFETWLEEFFADPSFPGSLPGPRTTRPLLLLRGSPARPLRT